MYSFLGEFALAIDVYQDNSHVVAEVAVGQVSILRKRTSQSRNDVLIVSWHAEEKKEVKREDYYCKKMHAGSFARSMILPMRVRGDQVEGLTAKRVFLRL
jgi:HSP20 family molecular chaperone IbpA